METWRDPSVGHDQTCSEYDQPHADVCFFVRSMKFFTYPSLSSFKRAYLDRSFDEVHISKPNASRSGPSSSPCFPFASVSAL